METILYEDFDAEKIDEFFVDNYVYKIIKPHPDVDKYVAWNIQNDWGLITKELYNDIIDLSKTNASEEFLEFFVHICEDDKWFSFDEIKFIIDDKKKITELIVEQNKNTIRMNDEHIDVFIFYPF